MLRGPATLRVRSDMASDIKIGDIVESVNRGEEWDGIQYRITKIAGLGKPWDLISGVVTRSMITQARYPVGKSIAFYRKRLKLVSELTPTPTPTVKRTIFANKGWGPCQS